MHLDSIMKKNDGSVKSGLKVLVFGHTGCGKTKFTLTFPDIMAVDTEDGMAWYRNSPNLKYFGVTSSSKAIEEVLDELDAEVDGEYKGKVKTFVIDSETKVYDNLQLSGLNVAERRARTKGQHTDDANLSQREWGKIKLVNKKLQSSKIMLASQGINVVSTAHEKLVKEEVKEGKWVVVDRIPETVKDLDYDYDIVIRMYTEEDPKTNETLYKGLILKDRTEVCKRGQVVDNPSFEIWREVYEKSQEQKMDIRNYKDDIVKDEKKMQSELETVETLITIFKKEMKNVKSGAKQKKVQQKMKDLGIDNPLKTDDAEALEELIEFVKVV